MSGVSFDKQLFEFVYAMCPYHEDVINASVMNWQLYIASYM